MQLVLNKEGQTCDSQVASDAADVKSPLSWQRIHWISGLSN